MFDHVTHWTKEFLSRPLGLGTSGSFTGAVSVLTLLKQTGEYVIPIGAILGVIATVYSLYLNYHKRRDQKEAHALDMEIRRKKLAEVSK